MSIEFIPCSFVISLFVPKICRLKKIGESNTTATDGMVQSHDQITNRHSPFPKHWIAQIPDIFASHGLVLSWSRVLVKWIQRSESLVQSPPRRANMPSFELQHVLYEPNATARPAAAQFTRTPIIRIDFARCFCYHSWKRKRQGRSCESRACLPCTQSHLFRDALPCAAQSALCAATWRFPEAAALFSCVHLLR